MKYFFPLKSPIKGSLLLIVLTVIFSLFTITDSFAETETVTADGMAGLQDNQAISRDNAVNDALRKAVEQAVGLMLSSETLVENSQIVSDNIFSKTQGYIKKYKIVKGVQSKVSVVMQLV